MPELRYRASIDHPPEAVFAFVADAENNPRWHAHVEATRWLDEGPTRPGRRARQTGHLFFRDWVFVAEVAEWEPPHRVAFQVIEGYRVRTTIGVEPSGDGTMMTLSVRTPTIVGRRVDSLVSRVMQRTLARRERGDIVRLRKALSTGSASPGSAAPSSSG